MKTFSQRQQDLFVLKTTNFLKNGLFVDIAAGNPTDINNTFLLESDYNWDGISIEIDSRWNIAWKERKSTFINQDAFSVDYESIFDKLLNKHNKKEKRFNYLSLDLEPPELTNKLLHFLPLEKYNFDIITYEHDLYRVGDTYKNDAKKYLYSLGYIIKEENVSHENNIFEDWYIHSSLLK
jgi:hypothetical protein